MYICTYVRMYVCTLACTLMTESDRFGILHALYAVGLSWAPVKISFATDILLYAFRVLPVVKPTSMGNQKFQSALIFVLTAD